MNGNPPYGCIGRLGQSANMYANVIDPPKQTDQPMRVSEFAEAFSTLIKVRLTICALIEEIEGCKPVADGDNLRPVQGHQPTDSIASVLSNYPSNVRNETEKCIGSLEYLRSILTGK